ncbi:MAG: IS607 family transposase [Candidatus Korarchaeota archaeon NZ13-K]|nr:MAG: IS607 family transposase [Candidatus Korarchaeota archaeon NZ13-K]
MERHYTMREAAKILGVSVRTIQRWDKAGKIGCVRTPGGKRRVPDSEIRRILGLSEERIVVGYARVSSRSQKDDLERQVRAIREYADQRGYKLAEVIADIGSGLNERRKGYLKLLDMVSGREVNRVIVTYPDRLTRFGFSTLRRLFQVFGTEIEMISERERTPKEELVEDLIAIVAHFAGRLYGRRSHKYRRLVQGVRRIVSG